MRSPRATRRTPESFQVSLNCYEFRAQHVDHRPPFLLTSFFLPPQGTGPFWAPFPASLLLYLSPQCAFCPPIFPLRSLSPVWIDPCSVPLEIVLRLPRSEGFRCLVSNTLIPPLRSPPLPFRGFPLCHNLYLPCSCLTLFCPGH